MTRGIKQLITILFLFIFIDSCTPGTSFQYHYKIPVKNTDGLEVGSLTEVGIDSNLIVEAVKRIGSGKYGEVHSILIFKDGKLVLDEYFNGHKYQWEAPNHFGEWVAWTDTMQHCAHSVTKSITSLCVGIAIDKGFIKNVNQSIFDYLPGYEKYKNGGKENITIEHLLTMTSGLKWDEWNAPLSSVENDQIGIWFSDKQPLDFILDRPLIHKPGTYFNYSGGSLEVLREILENTTQMTIDAFSDKYLFEPLGIDQYNWWLKFPNGKIIAAAGLKITPRGLAIIGATILNNGKWNSRKIISNEWVQNCFRNFNGNNGIKIPGEDMGRVGYSYTWWTKEISQYGKEINLYYAGGWGGQKIIVLPEINSVIVFTGANYNSKVKQLAIIEDYILPAIK